MGHGTAQRKPKTKNSIQRESGVNGGKKSRDTEKPREMENRDTKRWRKRIRREERR